MWRLFRAASAPARSTDECMRSTRSTRRNFTAIPTCPPMSDPFMRHWNGKSVKELFDLLSRSMPADNRGGLSARTYTDLIAYLLRANEAPAGSSALPVSPAALESISIENP